MNEKIENYLVELLDRYLDSRDEIEDLYEILEEEGIYER